MKENPEKLKINKLDSDLEGILLVDKPKGCSSFYLVKQMRFLTKIQKIGHCGTLDPFATGLMILLIGKSYTRLAEQLITDSKSYTATCTLGSTTPSYDCDTPSSFVSSSVPSLDDVKKTLAKFQGELTQIPPMFSAKKIGGKRLYELARQGLEVKRAPQKIFVHLTLVEYQYPHLTLNIDCSKGTYIRSLGHEIGQDLGVGAYLSSLRRTKSGLFSIDQASSLDIFDKQPALLPTKLLKSIPK